MFTARSCYYLAQPPSGRTTRCRLSATANSMYRSYPPNCSPLLYQYPEYAPCRTYGGLEVHADRTKYIVMSRKQNAGRNHNIKNDNSCFERMEQLKYLGTTKQKKTHIQEKIKSRLKSGNACYHSVQNLLSSSLLSQKYNGYNKQNLLFCMGVKLGRSHRGKNAG